MSNKTNNTKMIEKMEIEMAKLPLVYLNEILTYVGKAPYEEAAPLITKIHKSVQVTKEEVDVEVPDKEDEEPNPMPEGDVEAPTAESL